MQEISTLGGRIADLRKRRGWTQRKLAEEAGLSATFISEVEGNKRKRIGYGSLLSISDALGATLDYLATGQTDRKPIRRSLILPPGLVDAADASNWSIDHMRTLIAARDLVIARRTRIGTSRSHKADWSKEDWLRFHERLFGRDDTT